MIDCQICQPEALGSPTLRQKKIVVVRALIIWMSPIKFLSRYPFALHYGLNSGRVNVFCLGGVVCIKLSENGSQIKLYHMNDNPDLPSESNVEN